MFVVKDKKKKMGGESFSFCSVRDFFFSSVRDVAFGRTQFKFWDSVQVYMRLSYTVRKLVK